MRAPTSTLLLLFLPAIFNSDGVAGGGGKRRPYSHLQASSEQTYRREVGYDDPDQRPPYPRHSQQYHRTTNKEGDSEYLRLGGTEGKDSWESDGKKKRPGGGGQKGRFFLELRQKLLERASGLVETVKERVNPYKWAEKLISTVSAVPSVVAGNVATLQSYYNQLKGGSADGGDDDPTDSEEDSEEEAADGDSEEDAVSPADSQEEEEDAAHQATTPQDAEGEDSQASQIVSEEEEEDAVSEGTEDKPKSPSAQHATHNISMKI